MTDDVEKLISTNAPVAIGVSGGKDSQAAALATLRHLDAVGHTGPRILIHADLGSVEWDDSLRICEELSDYLNCELVVVRRRAGDLMDRWERRWFLSKSRYETLSSVTLIPCWSTPSMRFCTSELKTHVIMAELKRRFKGQKILNVIGVRRDESAARARMSIADPDPAAQVWTWRPIIERTTDEVFDMIDSSGLQPHPAYRIHGMTRVSCRFCIMSSIADLTAASAVEESHDIYRRMVQLEIDSSFAFQGARWLGDIAPHLLTVEMRGDHWLAKSRAARRVEIEKHITKPMLYVKGWPTRMLTDEEANILCDVRNRVTELYGFKSDRLTVDSIHQRYADLLDEKAQKEAA
ncbi:phosphoadenosine phosphosulfate reductase domain-containing protein [Rhizobium bangladeshense]|uniref:phosphoadenosine phosphosulfate reductase domain-containing protein n=1 Tax=Rhizobium bangladeshense TaxID=1138189 RepID=UPI002180C999|nr:phosphoadenosine phosphosulfate reductase family protein [Rhizobium bangladeshense]